MQIVLGLEESSGNGEQAEQNAGNVSGKVA